MANYKFRDPDYVGFWNTFDDSRSSIFLAYMGGRISDGRWLIEHGRMIDRFGVIKFETGHDSGGRPRFKGAYVSDFSGGCSREIECDLSVEEYFVRGIWRSETFRGEFAATKFGSPFVCSNLSMKLLSARECERLGARLAELTREFPLSPPIPEALEEIK